MIDEKRYVFCPENCEKRSRPYCVAIDSVCGETIKVYCKNELICKNLYNHLKDDELLELEKQFEEL